MRPATVLALGFALLGVVVVLLGGMAVWLLVANGNLADNKIVSLAGTAAVLGYVALLVLVWAVLHLRLIRPVEAITREIETLTHSPRVRPLELPEGHGAAGLEAALQGLVAKFCEAREETEQAVATAVSESEQYQRRLEAILFDMSEGVIVCNLENRVLLYNHSAVQLLDKPEALGLGRRLFGVFDRAPITRAVNELIKRQRADTSQKLQARRQIKCRRLDTKKSLEIRISLICSDEIETEGYVLTFNGGVVQDDEVPNYSLPPRPEFYDFDLFRQQPDRELTEVPLRELRCVVFDTETTGLEPSKGDEIISIGAVRLVNGKIVQGETFEQLVDPGRPIPKSSTRFHGLSDEDVKHAPRLVEVLPRFQQFVGSSVLIAHNAAFDMKFLELKEDAAGVAFRNPVLDVLLLSAFLHDHATDHSLNEIARRFGIEPSNRHRALDDAVATAEIFCAMLDPLGDRGVIALGDALDVSAKMTDIRREQAKF